MTTPIGDAAAAAVQARRRGLRRTSPQPVLSAPVPRPAITAPAPETAPVPNHPEPSQEETMSPVAAALAAVQHQAALLERDANANPLAVIITARHVGKTFTVAECVAIADFIAAVEAERGTQADRQARANAEAMVAANGTGPQQRIMS